MPDGTLPWVSNPVAQDILTYVQIAYPIVLICLYIITFTIRSITTARNDDQDNLEPEQLGPGGKPLPQKSKKKEPAIPNDFDFSRPRKLLFEWLSLGVLGSIGGNIAVVIVHAIVGREEHWWCGQSPTIYLVGSFMVYALLLITMIDSKPSPTLAHLMTWVAASLMEIILLGASFGLYSRAHREPRVGEPGGGELQEDMTEFEITEVTLDLVRIIFLLALVGFYALFVFLQGHKLKVEAARAEERQSLLAEDHAGNGAAGGAANGYGTANGKPHGPVEAPAGWEKPKETPSRSWWEYLRAYTVFLPYIWPYKDRMLQVNFILCFVIVGAQRVIQLLVPIQAGNITDILAGVDGPVYMPWGAISLYIVFRIFQGSNGLLGAARQVLWIPIEQYSYRELSVAAFEHVHMLSLEFHLGKKTGEVLSALGKGSSLNTFLESITFNVLPMLIDLAVALVYLLIRFDAYYALVIAVITFWYIYITIRMASWRADIRRQATNASREEDAVKNDSMMSYETVKYFNAERYEFSRYHEAVKKYQKAEYLVTFSLALMNTVQNLVFMLGLIVALLIAAYQVTTRQLQVGDFVRLLSLMTQLQGPLNFFGTFYRMIQNNMINSERMLELFKEKPTVVDKLDATEMPSCEGEIRYNDVHFSYDARRPALQGLTFRCKPGTTTALVGESGGGKSTVFRLLFRFYNSQGGNIQIDAHDVQETTIDSLRKHIGVVPQDTVLFNESLMYNLKYARQSATDEEVYEACRAASIHEKILGFPDGYDTKVGERGLRLSGGEKQRVAIARTIIKDPRIILLDEATAALDTETEEHIQEALKTLAQGRTMLVIAHRLSTITMCDQILVLHEGRVVERGTHNELLAMKGRYSGMWKKQVRAQRAAEEARVLKDKADRLRRESMGGTARAGSAIIEERTSSSDEEEQARRARQNGQADALLTSRSVPVSEMGRIGGTDASNVRRGSWTPGQHQGAGATSSAVQSPPPNADPTGKPAGHP
ncbi:putative ABC transporter [Hortaea werneckii]|nr:putative ABC transporter [Hortaea werneckii]KAI7338755.1 putative ABC transporter [Hortaea werneckii]KAI7375345.1 putative ABC transporter [Hortaea werneckii]KAI7478725.1 putative ABC transporter [Hortaea werneckii]KAI7501097.1 putative ABC transporter [Hortaea werneckii]